MWQIGITYAIGVAITGALYIGLAPPAFADLDDLEDTELPAIETVKPAASPAKPNVAAPMPKNAPSPKAASPDLGPRLEREDAVKKSDPTDDSPNPQPSSNPSSVRPKSPQKASNRPAKQQAEPAKKKGPVRWKSKGLLATQEKNIVELEKDVEIVQDNLSLRADHSKIYFTDGDGGEVDRVYVRGSVHIEKKDEDPVNHVVAKSNEATYFSKDNKITLTGNARLWRQGNLVKGKKITYDLTTGWITVDSVEGVVQSSEAQGGSK